MNTIELQWIGKQQYLGTDNKGHTVVVSGDKDIGISPVELLLHSLAGCAIYDVIEIIQKQRATLHRLSIRVDGTRRDETPRKFIAITMTFTIFADNLSQAQADRAVALSLDKYCSVRASLDPTIPITTIVEVNKVASE